MIVSFSDASLGLLLAAASLVPYHERGAFLEAVSDQLDDPVTDGGVERAIRYVITTRHKQAMRQLEARQRTMSA